MKQFIEEDITYLRKSRKDGEGKTVEEVLERHESQLKEHCKNLGFEVPEHNVYREIVSGESISERPELLKVLKRIQEGNIRRLVILEPARLSRGDLEDAGKIINILRYNSVKVVTPFKTYNLEDKYDRKFFEMELSRSNEYLEYTKEILARGRLQSIKEGKAIMSTPPYGYDKEKLKDEKGYKLIPHKDEAYYAKLIFELCIEGMGTTSIANHLNLLDVPTRKGGAWVPATIRDILKNPTYVGLLFWQKNPEIKVYTDEGLKKKRTTNEDHILVKGRHDPLITDEQFLTVQEMLKNNATGRVNNNKETKNPLNSIVECSACGRKMIRRPYTQSFLKHEKRVYEIDKENLSKLLRSAKEESKLSLQNIADRLGVSKDQTVAWFNPRLEKMYLSKIFSDKWFELKELLNITTNEFDKSIMTYKKPDVQKDTLMCPLSGCKTVSSFLEIVEIKVLENLEQHLNQYKYFLDNYEEEIKKSTLDNEKKLDIIEKKLEGLKKELRSARRDKNKGLYSDEEYLETKQEIEEEMKELEQQRSKLEQSSEQDKLTRYKKAIPKLQDCIDKYHTLNIADKNEMLKSIIRKIIYTKEEGGRWNKGALDNFTLEIFLNI